MKITASNQKRAMFSVYAFCRIVDDIADDLEQLSQKNKT